MRENNLTYTTERYVAETDAKAYIAKYRKADYFIKLCRQCGNYGRRYGCPPFDHDPVDAIQDYNSVRIIGVKITPKDRSLPLEAANELTKPIIRELNAELLETERKLDGMCFGFAHPWRPSGSTSA